LRLIHVSDVHVQIDYRQVPWRRLGWRRAVAQLELQVFGRSRKYEQAEATLRQIAQDVPALRVDHVMFTGDFTALATREEFECARQALGPLADDPRRLSVIPGNHDRYTAHSVRDRRFEQYFGHLIHSDLPLYSADDGYPFVRLLGDALAVVGLDSTHLAPAPGLSFGRLGRQQLRLLARLLNDRAMRGRAVCVMVHHAPLHRHGGPDRMTHGLWDAAELLRVLAGRRCSLHHGHVHERYRHGASPSRPEIFGAGSSTALGDEGYWLLDWDGHRLVSARTVRPGATSAETVLGSEP